MLKHLLPALALSLMSQAAMAEDSVQVVELFTSQSCSSCPPADRLLGELAQQPNVIALSCHVTYWNHLHWKDTLSQEFCTGRQRGYAAVRNSNRVFTPEALINGQNSLVGSSRGQVGRALRSEGLKPIKLAENQSHITLQLPELPRGNYSVELISYGSGHTQAIPSGENRGRTVTYTNPVTSIQTLSIPYNGTAQNIAYKQEDLPDSATGVAVLIHQGHRLGPLVAAGKLSF